jgi:glyoxylase-like metal-dependent hydrolase (beta-lactamase superfamily II)
MIKKVFIVCILIYSLVLSGCGLKDINNNKTESQKIDSLIKVQEVNDKTVIVEFGYDAMTAIKTKKGIVLIDAGISTSLTARYKIIIENKFNQHNFVYVINSHGHHDHIRGNSLFPKAQVIGHENCQKDASEGSFNPESSLIRVTKIVDDYELQLQHSIPNTTEWNDIFTQKIRYKGSYCDIKNNIPFRFPDIIFSDSMKLECGEVTLEMIYFGKFHSTSDILIYVPEMEVLFTGDLFSKYGRPSFGSPSITDKNRWIHANKWIKKRISNIETIIDGHGQILTIDDLKTFNDNLLIKYLKEETK